jgi:hypothetical protein
MTAATSAHTVPLIKREEVAEGTMAFHFARPADFQFVYFLRHRFQEG